jgi:hypothetical protein
MKKLKGITLLALLTMTLGLNAQEVKTTSPLQVTFIYPVGSNGQNSMHKANNFSLNVIWGMNGGVNGFELGAIGNFNKGNVAGAQIGGITNINTSSINGVVISGITNLTKGNAKGLQLSGIANLNGGETYGLMLSGIANVSQMNAKGAQVSLINSAFENMNGFQLGLVNYTKGMNGFQLGLTNYAKKMKGFQLGLVNVSDTIDGIALGLISVTKDGYYAVEVSNSEVLYVHTSYKMGVSKLYNIYTIGIGRYENKDVYSYGLGLGSLITLHNRHSLAIEGITNQMAFDNTWDGLNLLNKVNLTYQFHLTNRISLFGGPSFNYYIINFMINGKYGTVNMPNPIWEHSNSNNAQYMWIGYNAGINIRL